MESAHDPLNDGSHEAELVAIPSGLLRKQSNTVYLGGRKAEAVEAEPAKFDIREAIKEPTRIARAASINIAGLQRARETGIQYPANVLSAIDERAEQAGSLYRFAGGSPVLLEDVYPQPPKQALTNSSRGRRRPRPTSAVISPSVWPSEANTNPSKQDRAASDGLNSQSHTFRDLSSFTFGQRQRSSNRASLLYSSGDTRTSNDRERFSNDSPTTRRRRTTNESLSLSPRVSRVMTTESLQLAPSQDAPPLPPQDAPVRRTTVSSLRANAIRRASVAVADTFERVITRVRKGSMVDLYEKAKIRQEQLKRSTWVQYLFEYTMYLLLIASVYLVLVGMPLWRGAVWYIYVLIATKFVIVGGSAIFMGLAAL